MFLVGSDVCEYLYCKCVVSFWLYMEYDFGIGGFWLVVLESIVDCIDFGNDKIVLFGGKFVYI